MCTQMSESPPANTLSPNVAPPQVVDASLRLDVRRLAPVAVADPHLRLRRYGSNVVPRPADARHTSGSSIDGPYVLLLDNKQVGQPYRNVYWPPTLAGTLHLRFLAVRPNQRSALDPGASDPAAPGSEAATPAMAATLPLSIGLESWRRNATDGEP